MEYYCESLLPTSQEITCKFNSYDSVKKYRLYSGYVLFNAISIIHVLRSDTFKAECIIGRFEHNSLERLAAASGCMSSIINRSQCDTKRRTGLWIVDTHGVVS